MALMTTPLVDACVTCAVGAANRVATANAATTQRSKERERIEIPFH
jgi:hypothetical protein